tara:strand:+ start:57 stop:359 length:303 start_codon:yes stop_codon:yes gene_type:complete
MSLISLGLIQLTRKKTLESFITLLDNTADADTIFKNNLYTMIFMILLLLITTIPAVLVAINCNKEQPIVYGIVAFLFSDIYLLQWAIKKFVFKYPNYCLL